MYWMSKAQKTGLSGEQWTLDQLTQLGYQARPLAGWTDQADLIITSTPHPVLVEVKLATRRERWQRQPAGHWLRRFFYSWEVSRLPASDLVIVLAADAPSGVAYGPHASAGRAAFVLPSWAITGRGVSVIHLASDPAAYVARGRGWLAPYWAEAATTQAGAWERVIEEVAASRQRRTRQLALFEG
jgi:hypothetical protein